VNHSALELGLRAHIGKEQSLPAHHNGFQSEEAAFVVRIERFGLFVERLLIDIRAIDKQRHLVWVSQVVAAIGVRYAPPAGPRRFRVAPVRARP